MLLALASPAVAGATPAACGSGTVYLDADGDGRHDPGERGLPGVRVSDGRQLVATAGDGTYVLPAPRSGERLFVIKPAGLAFGVRSDGLPDAWRDPAASALPGCGDFGLHPEATTQGDLQVLLFGDPQPKSMTDVDYFRRDIVEPLRGRHVARLGLSLGDIVDSNAALYPALEQVMASLETPWLHIPGNHDIDIDARDDARSLTAYHQAFGPDTFAWEEAKAVFVGLDDVIALPGQKPAYVGGLREDQFRFLEQYLPTVPRDRLLVLAVHIPLFDTAPAGAPPTFRVADRERLFALLRDFPHVLLLSAHTHMQQHVFHDAADGWRGAVPLHEYNVGAACGAYWSGAKDAAGIPDSTMSDGTPNGYATLRIGRHGDYALAWHPARDPADAGIGLHAPRVLRQGAYPAWGVYANVYMGMDDTRVEFRVDDGAWQPMRHVLQPDPALLAENAVDDAATELRGYDRSPEATPSPHLWRGALPTGLAVGSHVVEVRAFDRWRGEQRASTSYRLQSAMP